MCAAFVIHRVGATSHVQSKVNATRLKTYPRVPTLDTLKTPQLIVPLQPIAVPAKTLDWEVIVSYTVSGRIFNCQGHMVMFWRLSFKC